MDSIKLAFLKEMREKAEGRWAERILAELVFAVKMSEANGGKYDGIIEKALEYLSEKYEQDCAITRNSAIHTEDMLSTISGDAKKYNVICAAHAHLDMNWMWGYAETVAITLDTFRTMLNLMNEYEDFKFSQSQASVYKIVEEHDPDMLDEIRERIKEGRWEVTASTWVETDKNMPSGESLARHILYTRNYLSKLLDLDPDSLHLDFEPDTFGHSRNVPEILSSGGITYYYFCRGYDGYNLFRWKSPSGCYVTAYKEPLWYNSFIDANIAERVPGFCEKHGINSVLKVYGVGDHGGGPTRRDIEKLIEFNTWPIFPSIRFGTFNEFFEITDSVKDKLPVVDRELNYVFTGCYSSQTRIKAANRISEAKLNEAEAYSSLSAVFADGKYPASIYEETWQKVLFNHFHDILPGSGVIDTREHALGQFQHVLANTNNGISKALGNIVSRIDTSSLMITEENTQNTTSEGAGVGFTIKDFGIPSAERGKGMRRIMHFFNPSPFDRKEAVEITIWDWPGDLSRIRIKDIEGNLAKHQILPSKKKGQTGPLTRYWGHNYLGILVDVSVPAYGYNTYVLDERPLEALPPKPHNPMRVETSDRYVLENSSTRVVFDTGNMSVISFFDKSSGTEIVNADRPSGVFRLIEEDDSKGMTSWIVGRHMNIFELNQDCIITDASMDKDSLKQWITYSVKFRNSSLKVTVSLNYNSPNLNYDVECNWQETSRKGRFIPQLNFHMPFSYDCKTYKYDIPFGTIKRHDLDQDVPGNGWALATPDDGTPKAIMISTRTKYGFRGCGNSLSVSLIRSSYDPDANPESYVHRFKFQVGLVDASHNNSDLIEKAYEYNHPLHYLPGTVKNGTLPLRNSFMSLKGEGIAISAVKIPEGTSANNIILVRVYETEGEKSRANLTFTRNIINAWTVNINEKNLDCSENMLVKGNTVAFDVAAYSVKSICVEF